MQAGFVQGPVHTIGELQRLAGSRALLRIPESDDVVVGFVRRGDFHQFDGALAPVALRLHPGARAQLVAVVEVFVAGEFATALEQAEALRILHAVGADREVFRVVQRTPDPLAVAGMDLQAGGVMQLGAEVVLLGRLVGTEQEHAGERRQAQLAHAVAQIDTRLHVDHGLDARTHDEAIGTGGTRRIEQGEDHQMLVLRFRTFDPELAEAREFLTGRQRGVQRQAAGGKPPGMALADDAEIAGAEERRDLVLLVGLVDRVEDAEAGVAEVLGGTLVELQRTEVEL
ncbi:hypothetical protein D3C80_1271570 [compost metagenome]